MHYELVASAAFCCICNELTILSRDIWSYHVQSIKTMTFVPLNLFYTDISVSFWSLFYMCAVRVPLILCGGVVTWCWLQIALSLSLFH